MRATIIARKLFEKQTIRIFTKSRVPNHRAVPDPGSINEDRVMRGHRPIRDASSKISLNVAALGIFTAMIVIHGCTLSAMAVKCSVIVRLARIGASIGGDVNHRSVLNRASRSDSADHGHKGQGYRGQKLIVTTVNSFTVLRIASRRTKSIQFTETL
jgi:hypothetical protein